MARPKKKTAKPKLKPTAGYALVEPVALEKKTAAGIVLPDTHDEKSQKGRVISIGAPQTTDSGRKIEPEFKAGDLVIFKKWGADEVKFDIFGKELVFVKFEDVLAVLR